MTFRFLIDECLSPDLVQLAVAAGHVESTCVRNRGWAGTKDWQLIEHAVAGDYTLVSTIRLTSGEAGRAIWAESIPSRLYMRDSFA